MDILLYLGKTSLIIALFYGVYQLALKKETFFTVKRHFLLGGIIAAIVIPFVEFTKTIYRELPVQVPIFSSEAVVSSQAFVPEDVVTLSWEQLVFIVYCIGASIVLLRFLIQLISLFSFLYKQEIIKKNGYSYIETSLETPPFSFFKYIVYNPALHTKDELQIIMKHEEVHAVQKHSIDTIIANILLVFQWFNPLAWQYKKSIEENLEFIADRVTVQQTQALKQYQLALVKASSTLTITGLATNFHQSFIKKRIIMLNKRKSHRINVWKLSIILPFLAFFLWSFNVKEVVEYTENEPVSASEVPKTLPSFSTSETPEILSNQVSEAVAPSEEMSETNPTPIHETTYSSEAVSEKNNTSSPTNHSLAQEIMFQISKNSTKEELDALEKELKGKGFTFNYSNVSFNSAHEITGITIAYKDGSGNSGKYSVHSDSPINTIIIKSEGSRLSVSSANNTVRLNTNQTQETNEDMEERREEMHEKMEQKREEMALRREALEERSNEQRERMLERSEERREQLRNQANQRRDSLVNRLPNQTSVSRSQSARQDETGMHARTRTNGTRALPKDTKNITKNSSDTDLDTLKDEFKAAGISFSYHGIKRNDAGEITKIKLKIDNNNGSITSSTYNKGGDAINTIVIGADATTTLLSSSDH